LRLIDSCITQLKAQGPSRTCNESREEPYLEIIVVHGLPPVMLAPRKQQLSAAIPRDHGTEAARELRQESARVDIRALCLADAFWRFACRYGLVYRREHQRPFHRPARPFGALQQFIRLRASKSGLTTCLTIVCEMNHRILDLSTSGSTHHRGHESFVAQASMAMFDRFAIFHKGGAVLWNKEASSPRPSSPKSSRKRGSLRFERGRGDGKTLVRTKGGASDSTATPLEMGVTGEALAFAFEPRSSRLAPFHRCVSLIAWRD